MGKFSISGDSVEEVLALADSLRAMLGQETEADRQAAIAVGESATKPRRTRKQPVAPDPIQPPDADAAPAPEANPFAPAPEVAQPVTFAPAPEVAAPVTFTHAQSAPFAPAPEVPADRPAVARLKAQLDLLSGSHGRAQVMAWAMQNMLGIPPSVDIDAFLTRHIHNYSDEQLDHVYKTAGGK